MVRAGHRRTRARVSGTQPSWGFIVGVPRSRCRRYPGDGRHDPVLTITDEESGLKGKFVDGDRKFNVTDIQFKDGKLTFSARTEREGEAATATYEGKVKGDAIAGSANWMYQGMSGSFGFGGKREAARPEG
jgi:hypothetical protein